MIDREMIDKEKEVHVAFVGNPNCGKTTLFNALTGAKLKVANWPGVTVEKVEGESDYEGFHLTLVDTPGIYSLTSYTIEEKVTRQCVMDDDIEVIVNIVDASSLERNLYLTLQLLELGKPVVLALNMMDIVEERGMEIDLHRLPEMLGGIPVVPVSAARRTGLDILLHAVVHHYEEGPKGDVVQYGKEIEEKLEKLEVMMKSDYPTHSAVRWHAIKLLEDDEEVREDHPVSVPDVVDRSYEKEIIQAKYAYIEGIIEEVMFYRKKRKGSTDKADSLLTHPIFGVPMFLLIMGFVFFLTFTVGDLLKGYFEVALDHISAGAAGLLSFRMAGIFGGGRYYSRSGGDTYLYSQYFYSVPGIGNFRGQRLHGQGGICYGRHYGKSGSFRQSFPAHDTRFRLYGAGYHGYPCFGDGA